MRPGVAIKDRVLFFTREGAQWFRKGADDAPRQDFSSERSPTV